MIGSSAPDRFRMLALRPVPVPLPACVALLSAALLAGCGGGDADAPTPAAEVAGADAAGPTAGPNGEPAESGPVAAAKPADPVSPLGTFRLIVPRQDQTNGQPRALLMNFGAVTIAERGDAPAVTAFNPTEQLAEFQPKVSLLRADAGGVALRIDGEAEGAGYLQFEGTPVAGSVIGMLHDETGDTVMPARLDPLPVGEPNPGPPATADPEFAETIQAIGKVSQSVEGLPVVARRRPGAATFFLLYPAAIAAEAQEDKPVETIRALTRDYVEFASHWGPWAAADARRKAGAVLVGVPKYRAFANEQFEAAVEALPDDAPGAAESWAEQFAELREEADLREKQANLNERIVTAMKLAETDADAGLTELRSIRADLPNEPVSLYVLAEGLFRHGGDAGREELRELHERNPLEAVPTYLLAEAERAAGNDEAARALFAEAAAVPLGSYLIEPLLGRARPDDDFAQPRERLNDDLNDPEAVADLLTDAYERLAGGLAGEPRPADGNGRTVLAELFTGSQCPPCVAADMATAALAGTFPREDLIVLQYHLHIPGPDPLTNADTVARGGAVGIRGTPTLFLDGEETGVAIGGSASNAADAYAGLVEAVETRRAVPPAAAVTITPTVSGERFEVKVGASAADGFAAEHRLHVAVAEDRVRYAAPNGIRVHEMLVRAVPTGAAGVRPGDDGALSFRFESSVSGLRDDLSAYLTAFERANDGKTFPDKPMGLDGLSVVAWVADAATGEVLQSAVALLEGLQAPTEPPAAPEVSAAEGEKSEPEPEEPAPIQEEPPADAETSEATEPAGSDAEPAPVAAAGSGEEEEAGEEE